MGKFPVKPGFPAFVPCFLGRKPSGKAGTRKGYPRSQPFTIRSQKNDSVAPTLAFSSHASSTIGSLKRGCCKHMFSSPASSSEAVTLTVGYAVIPA